MDFFPNIYLVCEINYIFGMFIECCIFYLCITTIAHKLLRFYSAIARCSCSTQQPVVAGVLTVPLVDNNELEEGTNGLRPRSPLCYWVNRRKVWLRPRTPAKIIKNKSGNGGGGTVGRPATARLLLEQEHLATARFARILDDGTEAWVTVRNNVIRNGGVNQVPLHIVP